MLMVSASYVSFTTQLRPPDSENWCHCLSRCFHSHIFHPCRIVPIFPPLHFLPLKNRADVSTPPYSTPAFLTVPIFPLPHFQSPRGYREEIMIVGRTVWTQSTSVTDRQTDRITITKTVQCIASHGKKQRYISVYTSLRSLWFWPRPETFVSVSALKLLIGYIIITARSYA